MRFLVHEQPYESLLASGRLRYEEAGLPTGAVETWRLTHERSGFRILRVDLDARDAPSGDSYLYHLVLNRHGLPERLNFRFFGGNGHTVSGTVLLEADAITASREVNGERFEDELDVRSLAVPWVFWFPSSIGLGLLAAVARNNRAINSVTLDAEQDFALVQASVAFEWEYDELLTLMDAPVRTLPVTIKWRHQERCVWIDAGDHPLKMQRDNLVAIETRYIRHADTP